MKNTGILLVLIVAYINPLFCQISEERNLSSFDKLKVSSEVKVFLSKGFEEKIKIVATGLELSDIETTISAKTLLIELSRGLHIDASVELYLTYKEIREITVGASGKVSVQNQLTGDKIVLNANTNGELTAELNLKTVDIRVGQGGLIRISGKTGSIDAKVSTGGIFSALDIQSDSTYVNINSAGMAKVNALFLLDAKVRSGGTLTYNGSPKVCNIKTGIGTSVYNVE